MPTVNTLISAATIPMKLAKSMKSTYLFRPEKAYVLRKITASSVGAPVSTKSTNRLKEILTLG
jgi:hypothetical protein